MRNCETYDRHRSNKATPKAPLGELPVAGPFEVVFLDLVGGQGSLNASDMGPKAILTMIDSLTVWGEAVPVNDQTPQTVSQTFFDVWISRFGVPYRVHSDLGAEFESALFARLCELLKIRHSRTTAYRPQANGKIERFNRTLVGMLKRAVEEHPDTWEETLPQVLMAYRSTIHSSTGYTPYRLAFGREMRQGIAYAEPFPDPPSTYADFASHLAETLAEAHSLARETLNDRHRAAKERTIRDA